jgi:hypothetical protein
MAGIVRSDYRQAPAQPKPHVTAPCLPSNLSPPDGVGSASDRLLGTNP